MTSLLKQGVTLALLMALVPTAKASYKQGDRVESHYWLNTTLGKWNHTTDGSGSIKTTEDNKSLTTLIGTLGPLTTGYWEIKFEQNGEKQWVIPDMIKQKFTPPPTTDPDPRTPFYKIDGMTAFQKCETCNDQYIKHHQTDQLYCKNCHWVCSLCSQINFKKSQGVDVDSCTICDTDKNATLADSTNIRKKHVFADITNMWNTPVQAEKKGKRDPNEYAVCMGRFIKKDEGKTQTFFWNANSKQIEFFDDKWKSGKLVIGKVSISSRQFIEKIKNLECRNHHDLGTDRDEFTIHYGSGKSRTDGRTWLVEPKHSDLFKYYLAQVMMNER